MGGRGRILALSDTDSPPTFHILQNQMNFPPSLVQAAVGSLNWHTASPDWVSVDDEPALALTAALAESAAATATGSEAGDAPMDDDEVAGKGEGGNEDSAAAPAVKKGRVKTSKVGRLRKKVRAREELLAVREEFLKGEWDGCVSLSPPVPLLRGAPLTRLLSRQAHPRHRVRAPLDHLVPERAAGRLSLDLGLLALPLGELPPAAPLPYADAHADRLAPCPARLPARSCRTRRPSCGPRRATSTRS